MLNELPSPPPPQLLPSRFGTRHFQVFMVFLCYILNFLGRVNCSFALVAMTNSTSANPDFPEYKWDDKQMSYIISAANIGVTLSLIPGSFMCRWLGVKTTMNISNLGSAILSLITTASIPFGGWQIFVIIRFIQGIFQGLFFPCASQHLANWAAPNEVTRLGALSANGVSIGIVLAMFTSGFIAKSSWGWPGIFYFAGGLGIAWSMLWMIFGDSSPTTSKFISRKEKEFIVQSQKKTKLDEIGAQQKTRIPWKAIFTSPPFLSLIFVQTAGYWGYSTILLEIPLYMNGILYMDIKSNSIYSSLPFIVAFFTSFIYLYLFNILMKYFSKNISKKIINSMAMWIPAAALFWIGSLDVTQTNLAVLLMVITVGVNSGITVGSGINFIELSPNHAAFLGAVIVTAKGIASIAAPLLKGMIVDNLNDRVQWQIVFIITGLIYFFGNLQFLYFGTSEKQLWDCENYLKSNHDLESDLKARQYLSIESEELIEKSNSLGK